MCKVNSIVYLKNIYYFDFITNKNICRHLPATYAVVNDLNHMHIDPEFFNKIQRHVRKK